MSAPKQEHVDELRALLDLIERSKFASNDQRARYLLSSNWLRDNGAEAAARIKHPAGHAAYADYIEGP